MLASLNAQDTGGPTDVKAELQSYLNAAIANAGSVRQFDVLVRERQSFDNVGLEEGFNEKGAVIERFGLFRICVDLDRMEAGCYQFMGQSVLDLMPVENEGPIQQNYRRIRGVCLDQSRRDGMFFSREFPSSIHAQPWRPDEGVESSIFTDLGIPDFRATGVLFGGPMPLAVVRQAATAISLAATGRGQRRDSGDLLTLEIRDERPKGAGIVFLHQFKIDKASLMPVQASIRSLTVRETPGSPAVGTEGEMQGHSTRWKEVDGVFIPVSVQSSENQIEDVNGTKQAGKRLVEFDLHWFSINKPLDRKLLDGSCLADLEALMAVVDPAKCGADALVDPRWRGKALEGKDGTDAERKQERHPWKIDGENGR